MSEELVKRLRTENALAGHYGPPAIQVEAADRIEALERSVEFYRNAADQQDMAVAAKQERIASLEAALREADPHNAMLPPEGADHG